MIERVDLAAQVHHALRDAIVAGQIAPGTRLLQEDLATRLKVSRQPVLQALKKLEVDGLAIPADGRGTLIVAPLDPGAMHDFYALRRELDGLAAFRAAERIASRDALKLSLDLLQTGRRATQAGDLNALVRADAQFHRAIYLASGNQLLPRVLEAHWLHLERYMSALLADGGSRRGIWDEHAEQLNAINAGSAVLARTLAQRHADAAGAALQLRHTARRHK